MAGNADFGNQRAQNLGDARFDKDGVNLRTLRRFLSDAQTNTVSATVSGITAGNNISITGTTSAITVSLSENISVQSVSASAINSSSLSGNSIFSGSTGLESIIYSIASSTEANDITRVQPGSNILTGGTGNNPTISTVSSPFFNNLSASGTGVFAGFSASTMSGETIYSGSTPLSDVIAGMISASTTGLAFSGWTAGTGINSIVANNGSANAASGAYALVGGKDNKAYGDNSVVTGGQLNTASTANSFVGGGAYNSALGIESVVGGGSSGTASGIRSVIAGGASNSSVSMYSSVVGGKSNTSYGYASIAGGGMNNLAFGSGSAVAGGANNTAFTQYSLIFGGKGNYSSGAYSSVLSGKFNTASAMQSSVINGSGNSLSSSAINSVILGQSNFTGLSPNTLYAHDISGATLSAGTIYTSGISGMSPVYIEGSLFDENTAKIDSLSADTFYSGSTELGNLFSGLFASQANLTNVQPGLNTYTGGTSVSPTVNVSAATLDHLSVSGDTTITLSGTQAVVIDGSTNPRGITLGVVQVSHFPSIPSTRSITVNTNTGGQGDTSVMVMNYTVSGFTSPTNTTQAFKVNVDKDESVGGRFDALSVSTVNNDSGVIEVNAVFADASVNPVRHHSATLAHPEAALHYSTSASSYYNVLSAVTSTTVNATLFTSNNDFLYVGNSAKFGIISVLLSVPSSNPGIKAQFEYSLGGGTWTGFTPSDNTNGFRVNGVISWDTNALPGWSADSVNSISGMYWARIKRTANTILTYPVEREIKISVDLSAYYWDKNGDLMVNRLSASTLYSGSTDISTLFQFAGAEDVTRVQPGLNTYTGGTGNAPTVNVSGLTIDNINVSGDSTFVSLSATTLSGGTIYSGATDLSLIFQTISSDNNDITRVQPGSNITTGGTGNLPAVNLAASPSINGLTVSGTALVNEFSATTVSGGTYYSGSTPLSQIIQSFIPADQNDITRVQPGVNIFTGGTDNFPTVNLTGASLDNIIVSGNSTFVSLSATTISGETLYSGSTNLSSVFATKVLEKLPEGSMVNGRLGVSGASGDITVSLLTLAGANPAVSDPVYIRINDTVRTVNSNLSLTLSAGTTNWFDAGRKALTGMEIDYFTYIGWNAANSTPVLSFSRVIGLIRNDFSQSVAADSYLAESTTVGAAQTDAYALVGRFAAVLTSAATYSWTVPVFSAHTLVSRPVYETRWLDYLPNTSGFSSFTNVDTKYKVLSDYYMLRNRIAGTSNATDFKFDVPFTNRFTIFNLPLLRAINNGSGTLGFFRINVPDYMEGFTSVLGVTWSGSGTKSYEYGEYPIPLK